MNGRVGTLVTILRNSVGSHVWNIWKQLRKRMFKVGSTYAHTVRDMNLIGSNFEI